MLAMKRYGGCGYISDGKNGVLACPAEIDKPKGKLRLLPEGKVPLKIAHLKDEK